MRRLAQIDLPHARVGGDLGGRAFGQHRPPTSTVMRSAKRNTSSMSCSMNSDRHFARQRAMTEQLRALGRRDAGRGLVEQQDAAAGWRAPARSPPGAACRRQLARARRASPSSCSDASRRCASSTAPRCAPTGRHQTPPSPRRSQIASTTDSSTVRPREQRVDLEGARHAALDARVLRQRGDALVAEEHLARGRRAARRSAG